jgi:hypothetical protein
MKPFSAFTGPANIGMPLVAIDLGYSARKRSCGLAWTGEEHALEMQFGDAIRRTAQLLECFGWNSLLVVEAVLSTFHQANGNPAIRGDFETGRGWYYGAGVLSFAAARRFLQCLGEHRPDNGTPIALAEAFLSGGNAPTGHAEDAMTIRDNFWATQPVFLPEGVEPASTLIEGIPAVRVFEP